MALSPAMQWALNNGMTEADVYKNINDFLATSPSAAETQAQMAQYGISSADVAAATGGASGGMLSGNILAGASWNSLNETLGNQLTEATGQATANYAVGGATTADTLNQLNTFISGGGTFDSNATVFLQTGGVDFIQGVDKNTVKDNINQIVKTLGDQGVNVVLTGSPYAASIQDVQTNNFNPEVDQIFKDIAKENSNVALVGTQGEILQNKALLVDALHTNAEGTAIYNQSVIDALSQFKNDVPVSTPQAITQAEQTNRVIPTARGTVIEGDNIEAQMAGVPQVVYETRVDPNNKANWQTVNPTTGEVINSGTFAGGGDQGLLAASRPVLALAASVLGAPYLSNLIAGSTGLTGSALAGATGATIAGGSTALTGGSAEDTLKAALLGGGGAYAGNVLSNLDVPVDFNNMTQEQLNDALQTNLVKDLRQAGSGSPQEFLTGQGRNAATYIQESVAASNLANNLSTQGLNSSEIAQLLDSAGFVPTAITDALDGLSNVANTSGLLSSTVGANQSAIDSVNITGTQNLPVNAGGMLSTAADPRLTVTAPKTPQQVDQATMALLDSQLAANKGTAPPNLANVEVTAKNLSTTPTDAASILAATLPALPNIPAVATPAPALPTQTITAPKTPSVGDTLALLPATMLPPSITNASPTTPADTKKTNELGLTDEQMLKLLQVGLGLFGTVGATSALGGTNTPVTGIPTQTPPMYTDDYFTRVQQNYNRLLPAVPRDVASPLRDWYTSQYGA
jgi:hypothetical protein